MARKAAGGVAGATGANTASTLEQVVATSAGARARAKSADVIAGASPTPAPDIAPRFAAAPAKVEHVAGCYAIEADAAAGLPARILLDSAGVERRAFAERAGVTDASAGVRYAVKIIAGSSAPALDSYWQPTSGGGLRLSIGGQPPTSIELHPISPVAFTGTMAIGDRQVPVTVQRITDCPMR